MKGIWPPEFPVKSIIKARRPTNQLMKPGIYVHLPFCAVHCSYCDFPISTQTSLSEKYYQALHREIALRPAAESDTLYFGGGTPSLTPATELQAIKDMLFL